MRCYFSVNCPTEKVKQTLTEERGFAAPGAHRIVNALHKKFSIGFLRNNKGITFYGTCSLFFNNESLLYILYSKSILYCKSTKYYIFL